MIKLSIKTIGALIMVAGAALTVSTAVGQSASSTEGTKIENAFRGAMQDRSSGSPDEAVFVEKCSMCHRQMGMGTVILARRMAPSAAILENRTIPAAYVRMVVRRGLGNMPSISKGEVSDAQLAQIAAYLSKTSR